MKDIQGCPYHSKLSAEFKPFDLTDPFPFYKKARAEEPIFYSEELGYWVVTRFQDIKDIFGNWKAFASENAQQPLRPILPKAKALMEAQGMVGLSGLSGRIPPDHTRIRRVASMAFNLSRIKKLEPRIRALAIETIEKIRPQGEAEIIRELAYELPAYVIFMLLGVPNEDVLDVKQWAESRLLLTWGDLKEEEQIIHAQNMVNYWNYCQDIVRKRKAHPQDDFPSDMVALQEEGHDITDQEIAGLCYSMLFAGHETTTSLIGNGIRELLKYRETWQAICENPALIPNTVEEILRFSPSIVAWRRRVKETVEVGGVPFKEGDDILLVMGAGNRDDAQFTEGDTFNIQRPNAGQHLSMGSGIHFCLGAPLAKLEVKVVLEELTKRIPNLQLKPNQLFQFAYNTSFRAPVAVQTEW